MGLLNVALAVGAPGQGQLCREVLGGLEPWPGWFLNLSLTYT